MANSSILQLLTGVFQCSNTYGQWDYWHRCRLTQFHWCGPVAMVCPMMGAMGCFGAFFFGCSGRISYTYNYTYIYIYT